MIFYKLLTAWGEFMKEKLKVLIDMCFKTNIDKIKKIVSNKEIICFDLFDTLLLRNVNKPHDVFTIIEKRLGDKYPNFKENRINAEKKARQSSEYEEITLEEIYSYYPNISKKQSAELKDIEENVELSIIVVNKKMLDLYNYLINSIRKYIL